MVGDQANYLSLLLFLIETSLQGMSSGVTLFRTGNHSRFVSLSVMRRSHHAV